MGERTKRLSGRPWASLLRWPGPAIPKSCAAGRAGMEPPHPKAWPGSPLSFAGLISRRCLHPGEVETCLLKTGLSDSALPVPGAGSLPGQGRGASSPRAAPPVGPFGHCRGGHLLSYCQPSRTGLLGGCDVRWLFRTKGWGKERPLPQASTGILDRVTEAVLSP